jgi:hypothetical protein
MTQAVDLIPTDVQSRLLDVKAIVLLAGSVRESPLVRAAQRPILYLPLSRSETVLGAWVNGIRDLEDAFNARLPLILSHSVAGDQPTLELPDSDSTCVVSDSTELRGTGGALRDLAERFEPDDLIVVANGNTAMLCPLATILRSMLGVVADVVLHADGHQAPTGFLLIRVGCLFSIAQRGFVDLKEQALPVLARSHDVRVVTQDVHAVAPIRALEGYIRAIRLRVPGASIAQVDDPLAEDWAPTFDLREDGAEVGEGARIHDSIVLAGARVGPGAVLNRSLAGPGANIAPGAVIGDQSVGTSGPAE